MRVIRLTPDHEAAADELVMADPVVNLFLVALMDRSFAELPLYGVPGPDDRLLALALVMPRLVVPFAPDPTHARWIGAHLADVPPPELVVGPREACDALLDGWGARPEVVNDQVLMAADEPPPPSDLPVRRARVEDAARIAELAIAMEREDLGRDLMRDPDALHRVVHERIADGRTWIAEQDGEIAFQVHVGTTHPLGAQIGGTYVPPRFRGRRLATAGMASVLRILLRTHPRVTLHVNEANRPAVRAYEGVGFTPVAPFRLTVQESPMPGAVPR